MKKMCFFLFLFLSAGLLAAQVAPVTNFYNKYKGMDKVTEVKLEGWVLKLAARFSDDESGRRLLEKITNLRVLTMEEGNLVNAGEYRRLLQDVRKARFEEIIKIKEDDQHIDLLIREDGDTITDVLLLINAPDNFILLSLEGALRFSDLNDLQFEVDGSEHFKKIPEKKGKVPQA